MDTIASRIFTVGIFVLVSIAALRAEPSPSAPTDTAAESDKESDKKALRPNLLIIGASSLNSPVAIDRLVAAMLKNSELPMHVEGTGPRLDAIGKMLGSEKKWDYVVMDAWHLGRGRNEYGRAEVPADFPKALASLTKEIRAHSPDCKIILFSWWVPSGSKRSNEGVMEVFNSCVEHVKASDVWVATTGPAFMEAWLDRADLRITKSKSDAHPGVHGAYINACSLFAIIADKSPVGLPATLKIGRREDFMVEPEEAKYLQELAWKVHQREIKNTKPAK